MKFLSAHRRDDRGRPDKKGKLWGYGSIAAMNRWNHKPHQHTREMARNLMTIEERRAAGYNDRNKKPL